MISAIVLAAGKSERMGRAKALLPFRGRSFLTTILDAISRSSIKQSVVVVGHHRNEIEQAITGPLIVFNPDYDQGMVTSLQAGLRALPAETGGAMLFLVDHPLVEPATIDSLIAHLAPGRIVLPVFQGRRGHPVLFAEEIFSEILGLPACQGANFVVHREPSRIIEVPLDTPGILVDIDTPQQFERLLEEEP